MSRGGDYEYIFVFCVGRICRVYYMRGRYYDHRLEVVTTILVGKPVEVVIEDHMLKEFRILTEVL